MRRSLTELTEAIKHHVCERKQFHFHGRLPLSMVEAVDTQVALSQAADEFLVSLTANFASAIVDKELPFIERKKPTGKEVEMINLSRPKRHIDYLWIFLSRYVPFFRKYIQYEFQSYPTILENNTVTREHYHLIPWPGKEGGARFEFMTWNGTHYNGSPEEWKDMQDILSEFEKESEGGPFPSYYKTKMKIYDLRCKQDRFHAN